MTTQRHVLFQTERYPSSRSRLPPLEQGHRDPGLWGAGGRHVERAPGRYLVSRPQLSPCFPVQGVGLSWLFLFIGGDLITLLPPVHHRVEG